MNILVTPPERRATLQLRDHRQLVWSEWGAKDGIPVLFCTGAGMSSWLGFGAADLFRLGLRLIAIDRPGLGSSDPHPTKTLSSWVEDVQELIQAEKLQSVLAVGFSQGAPFALALHDLVKAIAIVSGQDDLNYQRSRLPSEIVQLMAAIQADPVGFERQFAQQVSAEGLWQLVMGMSGNRDRALYAQEPFSSTYQRALQEGFSQGAQGYVRDLVNAMSPWSFQLEKIMVPVQLWYGALDTSPVHSPDFGATMATRLANATHQVEPEEGSSILWTRAGEILAMLIKV